MSDSPTPSPASPPPSPSPSPVDKAMSFLKFKNAPPFGGGTMPVDKEKTFVLLAHIFSWIIWLWKRKESPAVDAHGKESTNFVITYIIIVVIPLQILLRVLPLSLWWLISLVSMVIGLAALALVILAAIKAQQGKLLRYPINFRLIK